MHVKNRLFWSVAIISLLLDQLTKYWVVQHFQIAETQPLLSGVFHFTYVRNTGAAFSLFTGKVEWLRWLSLVVSLGLVTLGLGWFGFLNTLEQLGWGFVLGGAVGNGIDRFFRGSVVDFLDFRLIQFPVFNLADVSINIGIICLLIAAFYPASNSNRRMR